MEPLRILVVDDDPVSRRFVSEVLDAAGFATRSCGSLAEARVALRATAPEVVICDIGLPDGCGLLLREDAEGIPFVVMSAELSEARAVELRRSGCRAAVQKPVSAERLVAAIAAACASHGAPKEPHRGVDDEVVLDTHAARAATGSDEIAAGLRGLLLAELPAHRDAIADALARSDAAAARDVLHRLRSACGFCGANRLGRAVGALATALTGRDAAAIARARARFDAALAETLCALRAAEPA